MSSRPVKLTVKVNMRGGQLQWHGLCSPVRASWQVLMLAKSSFPEENFASGVFPLLVSLCSTHRRAFITRGSFGGLGPTCKSQASVFLLQVLQVLIRHFLSPGCSHPNLYIWWSEHFESKLVSQTGRNQNWVQKETLTQYTVGKLSISGLYTHTSKKNENKSTFFLVGSLLFGYPSPKL